MNYDTNSDSPIDPSIPALAGANANARVGDVSIFLCPSDPSTATTFNAGRLSYFGSMGATANSRDTSSLGGIFTMPYPANGSLMTGYPIAAVTDGTSNTALFSEVMRSGTSATTGSGIRDNRTVIINSGNAGYNDTDGTTISMCVDGSNWSSSIKYVGQEYYRSLISNFLYSHTVPPNWNKMVSSGTQHYSCGNSSFTSMHIAASSYHTGGVVLGLADGSVRFVADSISLTTWRAVGTRANGEVIPNY